MDVEESDRIEVGGKEIHHNKEEYEYWVVNKPIGLISSTTQEQGVSVLSLVESAKRLYPVGRLDKESEGLMVLTNDGELTYRMTHTRYKLEKVYEVTVAGTVNEEKLASLRNGVKLEEGVTGKAEVVVINSDYPVALRITLRQGWKRQIRRMASLLHLSVRKLKRIQIGPICLDKLGTGKTRRLGRTEVALIKQAVGLT